jgi:kynureninase
VYSVLESSNDFKIQILTPIDPEQRGSQLSLRIIGVDAQQLFSELEQLGVCVSSSKHTSKKLNSSFLLVRYSW